MKLTNKDIDKLCLFDDVFFRKCFDGHPECTEEVLKVILGLPKIKVIDKQIFT